MSEVCELAHFALAMAFCANFVLGNLSDRKSYNEKLQDTWGIVLGVLGPESNNAVTPDSRYIFSSQQEFRTGQQPDQPLIICEMSLRFARLIQG